MLAGVNDFVMVGFDSTVRSAETEAVEPALEVVTLKGADGLVYRPAIALVTLALMVQLPEAGMTPPASCSELPPAVAVTVPPQVLNAESGVSLIRLAG